MKNLLRILLPLVVIALGCGIYRYFDSTKEKPRQRPSFTTVPEVEATRLEPQPYAVRLDTYGTARPRTQSTLLPEVSGQILEISPQFREGSFFSKGDLLLRIDPVDYRTAVTVAEGMVAQMRASLAEERARAEQAIDIWKRLGKTSEPSELALRKPQLAEAEARLAAATAQVEKAERDLERTSIVAPYDGRVLEKNVDVGQVIREGTSLGRIFAVDYAEIRLPLNNDQLAHFDLETGGEASPTKVILRAKVAGRPAEWEGQVVRVEGAIDETTRQLHVVAQVDDPYGLIEKRPEPLKVGLFVEAEIVGREIPRAFVLPRTAVRADGRVVLVTTDSKLRLVTVDPVLSTDSEVILHAGPDCAVKPGDVLCLTPLAYPAEGSAVRASIDGAPAPDASGGGPPGSNGGKGGKGAGKRTPPEGAGPSAGGMPAKDRAPTQP